MSVQRRSKFSVYHLAARGLERRNLRALHIENGCGDGPHDDAIGGFALNRAVHDGAVLQSKFEQGVGACAAGLAGSISVAATGVASPSIETTASRRTMRPGSNYCGAASMGR